MAVNQRSQGFGGVPGNGLAVVDREMAECFDEMALAAAGKLNVAPFRWDALGNLTKSLRGSFSSPRMQPGTSRARRLM